jgi:hypothetical protein
VNRAGRTVCGGGLGTAGDIGHIGRMAKGRMAKTLRGLYRAPGWAFVSDGTFIFDMPEARYRDRGYEPHYDQLPSKREYEELRRKEKAFPGA